jgi:hypothetical protein
MSRNSFYSMSIIATMTGLQPATRRMDRLNRNGADALKHGVNMALMRKLETMGVVVTQFRHI